MRYEVEVTRLYRETGRFEVEADDEAEAVEIARDMLASDDDSIEWVGEGAEQDNLESVTPVDED